MVTDCSVSSKLSQSYPAFGIRGAPTPLLPHAGACHKASPPQTCKHVVGSGFLCCLMHLRIVPLLRSSLNQKRALLQALLVLPLYLLFMLKCRSHLLLVLPHQNASALHQVPTQIQSLSLHASSAREADWEYT